MSSNYYNKLCAYSMLIAQNLNNLYGKKLYIVFNQNMKIESITASASYAIELSQKLNVYESDAISIYNYLYLDMQPDVDEFIMLLLVNRLLNHHTIEEQAQILEIEEERYYKLERGFIKFTSYEKSKTCKKLNICSSKAQLFNQSFNMLGRN